MRISKRFEETKKESDSEDEEDVKYQRKVLKKSIGSLRRVYIEKFHGTPISLRISLLKQGAIMDNKSEDAAFFKTITSLGLSITSLENAPFMINAFVISNVYGDKSEILEQFKGHYKQQIKRNALSFIGASNLLGNPVGFMDQLGTGFHDFYYEPANGFAKGFKEGLIGSAKGTTSLMKNTVVGSVSSLGKISTSLGSAMLHLTGDDEFIGERNK